MLTQEEEGSPGLLLRRLGVSISGGDSHEAWTLLGAARRAECLLQGTLEFSSAWNA